MQERKTIFNTKKGMTIIELMITSSLLVVVFLLSFSAINQVVSQKTRLATRMQLLQKRQEIITIARDRAAWLQMYNDPDNASMACLKNNSDCSALSGTYTNFKLLDAHGDTPLGNTLLATTGLNSIAAICTGYSDISTTPDCPFRYEASWTPICPATSPCLNPSINVQLNFKQNKFYAIGFAGFSSQAAVNNLTILVSNSSKFFLYASETGATKGISAYQVDVNTGSLTAVSGSPFTLTTNPHRIVITRAPGRIFLYAIDQANPGHIYKYTINPATGYLNSLGMENVPLGAGGSMESIAYALQTSSSIISQFIYVNDFNNNKIYAYTMDNITGALTAVAGSPYAIPSPCNPSTMRTNYAGTRLYVPCQVGVGFDYPIGTVPGDRVLGYGISTTGALSSLSTSPYNMPVGSAPYNTVFSADESVLYVAHSYTSSIGAYSVSHVDPTNPADLTTGNLGAALGGSPYNSHGATPEGMWLTPPHLYFTNIQDNANALNRFVVAVDNTLNSFQNIESTPTQDFDVVGESSGRYIFGSGLDGLKTFSRDTTTGLLTQIGSTIPGAYDGLATVTINQ